MELEHEMDLYYDLFNSAWDEELLLNWCPQILLKSIQVSTLCNYHFVWIQISPLDENWQDKSSMELERERHANEWATSRANNGISQLSCMVHRINGCAYVFLSKPTPPTVSIRD